MRTSRSASPGHTRRRSRLGIRLAVLVTGALTLGFLTPLPASAAPGELIARDGAFYEYNDAVVRIALARRVNHGLSVGYRTISGTAVDGVDYIGKTGRVFFPAGTKVKKVRIAVVDDVQDESNEYFRLRLFEPRRATILDRTARVTIVDDDVAQTLSVRDASASEGNTVAFPVVLSQVAGQTVSFRYTTLTGTAGSGDFTMTSGIGSIPAGGYQTTISVPTTEDSLFESGETFRLVLSDVSGAGSGDLDATGTILNDDPGPQLRINDVSVSEGNSTTMTVTLSQVTGSATTVRWQTTDGTAKGNQDYVRNSGTLTIPAGATSGSITVQTYEDTSLESSEVFYVDLSSPVGATIADSRGQVTILDDDGPTLTVSDATVEEGNTHANFTVSLSFDPAHNVSFTWSTVNGTAAAPGDFDAVSENVTITSGTKATLAVRVNEDSLDEVTESFTVQLSNVSGANVADGTGVGTITDDDPTPTLTMPNPASVAEGQPVTFTVTLSAASGQQVSVKYDTGDAGDSATAPEDYNDVSGTLTFVPGDTSESFTVTTHNDSENGTETFTAKLSDPVNATIGDGTAVATLTGVTP